jgi:hypothetical protein
MRGLQDAAAEAAPAVAAVFRKLRVPQTVDRLYLLREEVQVVTRTRFWAVTLPVDAVRVTLCACDSGAFFVDTGGRMWGAPIVGPAALFEGSVFVCEAAADGITVVDVLALNGARVRDPYSVRVATLDRMFAPEEEGEDRRAGILDNKRVYSLSAAVKLQPPDVHHLRELSPASGRAYALVPETATDPPPQYVVNADVLVPVLWAHGKVWFGTVDDMHEVTTLAGAVVQSATFAPVPSGTVVTAVIGAGGSVQYARSGTSGPPAPPSLMKRALEAALAPVGIADIAKKPA